MDFGRGLVLAVCVFNHSKLSTINSTDNSTKAHSQRAAILAHLKRHGRIDMPTAWDFYGCAALRSRISDLRKQGIGIETKMVSFTSRFGHPGKYAVYILPEFEKGLVEKSALFVAQ